MDLKKLRHDPRLVELIKDTDQKLLARWAFDCVTKYLYLIEDKYPNETRPRDALNMLNKWLSDEVKMWDARKFTYPTLAVARELEATDKVACQIARACSHALATCHVKTHSEGSAMYVISALYYLNKDNANVDDILEAERNWQIEHLNNLKTSASTIKIRKIYK